MSTLDTRVEFVDVPSTHLQSCSTEWLAASNLTVPHDTLRYKVDCNHRWYSVRQQKWVHGVCINTPIRSDLLAAKNGGLWPMAPPPKRWSTMAKFMLRVLDPCTRYGHVESPEHCPRDATTDGRQPRPSGPGEAIDFVPRAGIARLRRRRTGFNDSSMLPNAIQACRAAQCDSIPGLHFFGASVVGGLTEALKSEARRILGWDHCEACVSIHGSTLISSTVVPNPFNASHPHGRGSSVLGCKGRIWSKSLQFPNNEVLAAQRRACSTIVEGSWADMLIRNARVVVIAYRIDHYGGGQNPAHYGILEEDIRRIVSRAKQVGTRVLLMTPSAQHFPWNGQPQRSTALPPDVFDRAAYEELIRDENRCLCVPTANGSPVPRDVELYRRLAAQLSLPLFDFYSATRDAYGRHVAGSCSNYARRTVNGVRAREAQHLLVRRKCCDCTHFCHSPTFWQRSGVRPLAEALVSV